MPEVDSGPTAAVHSHAAHNSGGGEGSRFRRFFKRFGRRPSDDEHEWAQAVEASDAAASPPVGPNTQSHGVGGGGGMASRARRVTATGSSGVTAASLGGAKNKWFGQGSSRGGSSTPGPSTQGASASRPGSSPAGGSTNAVAHGGSSAGFESSTASEAGALSGGGLSNTADTAAPERSPPPQLMQLPNHEPMVASDMHPRAPSSIGDGGSSFNHARSTHPRSNSSDLESLDRRTVDTGKSRASTKPTTLMSLEMRDQPPMAHIATHRHGEPSSSAPRASGAAPAASTSSGGATAVQFVDPDLGRPISGTMADLPGHDQPAEDVPFVNVPALSRPHPVNNPSPHAQPPDNASVLTLASSTAAQSIGGGAPSSRGHRAYSIGTRSIRRNSSDTYASLMALPPLSRRGSNESGHSGWTGGHPANLAGPGAPSDRVSVQRTPSQRTVATQLSIPFSASASNAALAVGKGNVGGGGDTSEGRVSLSEAAAPARTAASRIMDEAEKKESVKEDQDERGEESVASRAAAPSEADGVKPA